MVGILVLVDEDIAEFPLIVRPHVVKSLEEADRVENDIVKVQCTGCPEFFS